MHLPSILPLLLPTLVAAWDAPNYAGFTRLWQDTFAGAGGSGINQGNWNIITNLRVNNELQDYTTSRANMQLSGGSTLQIVPWRDAASGRWTSARVESRYTFTPSAGRVTVAEGLIRFGDNSVANKRGMWPAFWILGDAIRNGVGWPRCGELDILETVNGQLTGYGTAHCDALPGGACNEPNGIGAATGIPDQGWHTWRIQWDRRSGNWQTETITWYRDGQQFHQISGARIGSEGIWNTLARAPLFFILNVAVGGNWPGNPDGSTLGGYGSMMETAYVAVYQSA
ncbi:Glucan endo-1,3-beta-glucosidase A1 [Colletotrichum orbiculare MAFF 240422]|uniref:Glucan endo-1,3-beta-glucosidase A1 n=3 Tax=Colletotrichum orbiculare species complex TaxID=2707354 RepID=N4VR75_COLOR|nr:Glucan endo-1,3-beta-glucosidase A1 [Colletotrichum orbiculare MAFF 240422]TDZ29050.1 Glucan endo-1,3-beta-glucosidase A1 [Colletotrichum spinosum]TDZ36754.1 Glucan endo-1,3-beta-glucosidase A1 [Colletotrichum trifolii]